MGPWADEVIVPGREPEKSKVGLRAVCYSHISLLVGCDQRGYSSTRRAMAANMGFLLAL